MKWLIGLSVGLLVVWMMGLGCAPKDQIKTDIDTLVVTVGKPDLKLDIDKTDGIPSMGIKGWTTVTITGKAKVTVNDTTFTGLVFLERTSTDISGESLKTEDGCTIVRGEGEINIVNYQSNYGKINSEDDIEIPQYRWESIGYLKLNRAIKAGNQ